MRKGSEIQQFINWTQVLERIAKREHKFLADMITQSGKKEETVFGLF